MVGQNRVSMVEVEFRRQTRMRRALEKRSIRQGVETWFGNRLANTTGGAAAAPTIES